MENSPTSLLLHRRRLPLVPPQVVVAPPREVAVPPQEQVAVPPQEQVAFSPWETKTGMFEVRVGAGTGVEGCSVSRHGGSVYCGR